MVNPNAISLNLDRELGEAITTLINQTSWGTSTYFVKLFMEKHEKELIKLWNKQGKNGQEIFDKWYEKWTLTKIEQAENKRLELKEKKDSLVKAYTLLGLDEETAKEYAENFPEKSPE